MTLALAKARVGAGVKGQRLKHRRELGLIINIGFGLAFFGGWGLKKGLGLR